VRFCCERADEIRPYAKMAGPLVGSKLRYAEHRIVLRSAPSECVDASRSTRAPSCPGALHRKYRRWPRADVVDVSRQLRTLVSDERFRITCASAAAASI